jgi:hypothetical protein
MQRPFLSIYLGSKRRRMEGDVYSRRKHLRETIAKREWRFPAICSGLEVNGNFTMLKNHFL